MRFSPSAGHSNFLFHVADILFHVIKGQISLFQTVPDFGDIYFPPPPPSLSNKFEAPPYVDKKSSYPRQYSAEYTLLCNLSSFPACCTVWATVHIIF